MGLKKNLFCAMAAAPAPEWEDDASKNNCTSCSAEFTFFNRRVCIYFV